MKARHLETITLPMKSEVGKRYVPYILKAVLSDLRLTKLPALKTLTLNIDSYEVRCVVLK